MRLAAVATAMASVFLGIATTMADDTEIFTAYTPAEKNSNVVFLLDTSGSMNQTPSDGFSNQSKIEIVKEVFESLIFDSSDPTVLDPNNTNYHSKVNPKLEKLNIAVMRFDSGGMGGHFITEMKKLNNGNFKDTLWTAVNGLSAGGNTPLAEAAYEASLYFRGLEPLFGDYANRTDPPNILTGGNYKSPFRDATLDQQCSMNNHLVILTDGEPTEDGDADTEISALPGATTCSFAYNTSDCLPEVSKFLFNGDFYGTTDDGRQNVVTHTIAFDLDDSYGLNLLRQTSQTNTNGVGMAVMANNRAGLAEALEGIFKKVRETATSFVSPAVSISSSNRFVHDNNVYFGLFEPKVTPLWPGNLKGYQVDENGVLVDFSNPPIPALVASGETAGEISPDARSKWLQSTAPADGNNVAAGGAATRILAQTNRDNRVKTQNRSNPNSTTLINLSTLATVDTNSATINGEINALFEPDGNGNNNVTNAERVAIINWAISGNTNPIQDPLHSTPQVVDYGGNIGPVIFFGTNGGFLHAIDAESGNEKFAFIPQALLKNLKTIKDNHSDQDHVYGLDGPITVFVKDGNGDGEISNTSEDTVLIIVGMRRGGNSYYALDVTNPDNPKLQWQITGGSGSFADLGQTWAKPIITKLNLGNSFGEEVVLLSGGYDVQYDELSNTISNPKGNAIYAVGLRDGLRKWYASSGSANLSIPQMVDAIPSDVSAIDINSDGIADRLYAIDIKGRIFRIDFNNAVSDSLGNITYTPIGKMFADLQGGTRRFYYGVDIAYTTSGFKPVLHLSVGSGHRAHPLAASQDRFFSVWDQYVKYPLPTDYTALTTSDLVDVNTLPTNDAIEYGWYFDVASGEKVLSQAASMSGYVFFTTYTPPAAPSTTTCTPPLGLGKLYAVKLRTSESLSEERAIVLNSTGIPPSPIFMALNQTSTTDNNNGTNANVDSFASLDTRRVVLVGGENPLKDEDEDKLNTSDTSKTYWQIVN